MGNSQDTQDGAPTNHLEMYQSLINMGYPEEISLSASNKYPQHITKAMDWIAKQQNKKHSNIGWNHITSINDLKLGDHIYRHLKLASNMDAYWLQHHGIVTEIASLDVEKKEPNDSDDYLKDNVKVLEMTKHDDFNGVQQVTLRKFLDGRQLRRVKYGVSAIYQTIHIAGTCHTEKKSDIKMIIQRCNTIKSLFANKNGLYSLDGLNCEHFALFCITGVFHSSISVTQISAIAHNMKRLMHCGERVEVAHSAHHIQNGYHAIQKASAKAAAKGGAKVAAKSSSQLPAAAAQECLKGTLMKSTGIFVGIAVVLEGIFTAYRIHRYRTDVNYLTEDFKMDLFKGWTSTACVVGIGVIGIVFGWGWWVLLPIFGFTLMVELLFWWFNRHKNYKYKVFKQRGLSLDSSNDKKKVAIRQIKKEIRDEKLHPDKWKDDLPGKFLITSKFTEKVCTERKIGVVLKSAEKGNGAMIEKVDWTVRIQKGIKTGMIIYEINDVKVMDWDFTAIQDRLDLLDYPVVIRCFSPSQVEKEKKKRMEKYLFLMAVKDLIQEDIDKKCDISKKTSNKSTEPLAITWHTTDAEDIQFLHDFNS